MELGFLFSQMSKEEAEKYAYTLMDMTKGKDRMEVMLVLTFLIS